MSASEPDLRAGRVRRVSEAMRDAETVAFVRCMVEDAQYVTSVCTGALVLGAAGLLKGRRATTHWAYTDLLPLVGTTHEPARVVWDGPVVTAGAVTSGIDFALRIVASLAGEDVARSIQLGIEYDPDPPFDSGHPDRAPEAVLRLVTPRYALAREDYRAALSA